MLLEVIDANNWVRRVYEKDTSGLPLRNLFSHAFTHPVPMIYVFDGKNGKQARRKIYPEYKAGRAPADDQFYVTLELFKMLVRCTNKVSICIEGWEADDVIADMVKRRTPGMKIKIHSNDGDFLQLVDHEEVMITDVNQKLKDIPREDIALYKTLVGDTSDNIKGIKTFGPMTFTSMVEQGAKPNWNKVFSTRSMGEFQAADLHLTNSQWLWCRQNFALLLAYWDVVNFLPVPQELITANTHVGKPDMAQANAILKTVFQ